MAAQTGKGSIVQMEKGKPKGKCRKWKLVVSLGRDPRTGKYPQKARALHGTYTQAQKALTEFVAEINGGVVVRRSAWTFKDYADHFCELREKSGDYAASTNDATRGRLRQISRHIGGLKMQEITPHRPGDGLPRHAQRQDGPRQTRQGHHAQRHPQGRVPHVRPREEGGRHHRESVRHRRHAEPRHRGEEAPYGGCRPGAYRQARPGRQHGVREPSA